jgi:hypothetical protein
MLKILGNLLPLLLTSILVISFIGCAGKEPVQEKVEPTPEVIKPAPMEVRPNQEELKQIIFDSGLATTNVNTYKFDMNMIMGMEVIGGSDPGKLNMKIAAVGAENKASNEMHMTMDMNINTNVAESTELEISMELYSLGDWMYIKASMPNIGEQWMKMTLTEELRKEYNLDTVNQQIDLFTSPAEIEFLRYETIYDTKYYVVKLTPTAEAISKWLSRQQVPEAEEIDWNSLNIADTFKELSFICWITKDSKLLTNMNADMLIEMSYKDVGATAEDFEKILMDINLGVNMYDYNKAVFIGLPEEALKAIEITK